MQSKHSCVAIHLTPRQLQLVLEDAGTKFSLESCEIFLDMFEEFPDPSNPLLPWEIAEYCYEQPLADFLKERKGERYDDETDEIFLKRLHSEEDFYELSNDYILVIE